MTQTDRKAVTGNGLFRKKSLEKVSSPEQMNDYIRVTNPGVWLVLGAVIALLAGLFIWAAAGRLETTVPVTAVAGADGTVNCYVPEAEAGELKKGMTVRIDGGEYTLGRIAERPVQVDGSFDAYMLHVSGIKKGQWIYPAAVNAALAEGIYEAKIVTDNVAPISFLLN